MDRLYFEFDKIRWNYTNTVEEFKNESLNDKFYSWGVFSVPTKYVKCDGNDLAIRKCTFDSQIFEECNFSMIDASDSVFINCLFRNCNFQNANLHKAKFIGSVIINAYDKSNKFSESLAGAGMSQSKFQDSKDNKAMLINLNLSGCSFRHSVFEGTIFKDIDIEYTSFEDAYFNNCKIDTIDLRKSACRGVIFKNCVIGKYISSIEKTLGAIGALQVLEHCESIELRFRDKKITKESLLINMLKESTINFLNEGKLFEFINIMYYLLVKSDEVKAQNLLKGASFDIKKLPQKYKTQAYDVTEIGRSLYNFSDNAYKQITKSEKTISLDDVLYSLKIMYFLNVNEYILFDFLWKIFETEKRQRQSDYSDFLVLSQINQYFANIGERIKSNIFRLKFHNESASWGNTGDRNEFYRFCEAFIELGVGLDKKEYTLVSMHEGSIEVIFESLFEIQNILIAAAVLGCRFKIDNGKVSFEFSPKKGIKSYTDFLKAIFPILKRLKKQEPSEEEFNLGLKQISKIPRKIIDYLFKNKIKGDIKQNSATKTIEEKIITTRIIEMTENYNRSIETTDTEK